VITVHIYASKRVATWVFQYLWRDYQVFNTKSDSGIWFVCLFVCLCVCVYVCMYVYVYVCAQQMLLTETACLMIVLVLCCAVMCVFCVRVCVCVCVWLSCHTRIDKMISLSLVDRTCPTEEEAVVVNIFARTKEQLPKIVQVGDIFRGHRVNVCVCVCVCF